MFGKMISVFVVLLLSAGLAAAAGTPSPKGAHVYIISPKGGDVVTNPFTVQFGLKGMGIAPAGVDRPNTGHHHLLIDMPHLPDLNKPLPSGRNCRHYGGGQTEALLVLTPGEHKLQLLLGDKDHFAHDPPVISNRITIYVEAAEN